MKIFIDSADISAIEKYTALGVVDGVTTNPSIIAKSGLDFLATIKEICQITDGPVSAEAPSEDYENMLREGEKILSIADNVALKLPITFDGIRACKHFSAQGREVNMTLCFSANQALLAAKAGATYVSPFIGRLDDLGQDGMELIADIATIFDNYPHLNCQILAASIRSAKHITDSALLGADVATIPPKLIDQMLAHHLTDKGLAAFTKDWKSTGIKI